jgi:hypothetical protein
MTLPIVERLQDAAMTFSGSSLRRGCVDCGLSSNLADEAADTIEELVEALTKARNTLAGCGMSKIAANICDGVLTKVKA